LAMLTSIDLLSSFYRLREGNAGGHLTAGHSCHSFVKGSSIRMIPARTSVPLLSRGGSLASREPRQGTRAVWTWTREGDPIRLRHHAGGAFTFRCSPEASRLTPRALRLW
jgi:hypothetical protein